MGGKLGSSNNGGGGVGDNQQQQRDGVVAVLWVGCGCSAVYVGGMLSFVMLLRMLLLLLLLVLFITRVVVLFCTYDIFLLLHIF